MKKINLENKKNIAINKCPICKKKSVKPYVPFCSKSCSDIDLYNWIDGMYYILDKK